MADVTAADMDGKTALHHAKESGQHQLLDLLWEFERVALAPSQQATAASGDRGAQEFPEPMCREVRIKKVKGRRKRRQDGRRSASLRDAEPHQTNGQAPGLNYEEDGAFNMKGLDKDMVFVDLVDTEPGPGIS